MSRTRWTLDRLRRRALFELDAERWTTTNEISERIGLGHGHGWTRLALVLERLVVDGEAEIERPGTHVRRFRRDADRGGGSPTIPPRTRNHPTPVDSSLRRGELGGES
jgi:hypothetical protein